MSTDLLGVGSRDESDGAAPGSGSDAVPSGPDASITVADGEALDAESIEDPYGCPINPCPSPTLCCYVKKTATAGTFSCLDECAKPAQCVGPQQCTGSRVCCAEIKLGPGTAPECAVDNLSSSCVQDCEVRLPMGCNVTGRGRLCTTSDDCKGDSVNKYCCTWESSGYSPVVCMSEVFAKFPGFRCVD